jgi:AcrR family transcriptional regulator
MAAADPPASTRGRQAEARRNDRAVLEAAREVFAVHGPDASVAQVAAQAGVGMGSLYRRYPTKEALLQHLCRASMLQQVRAAEEALAPGGDPWEALAGFVRECVGFRAGVLSAVAGRIAVTEEMRAIARHAHDLLEQLVQGNTLAHERLLAMALDGLRSPGFEALPEPVPDWQSYVRRWSGH